MAGVAVIGQPNVKLRRLDNPIEVPGALSFLAYGTFESYVHGSDVLVKKLSVWLLLRFQLRLEMLVMR